jgi:AcrR family transcriptional regulator
VVRSAGSDGTDDDGSAHRGAQRRAGAALHRTAVGAGARGGASRRSTSAAADRPAGRPERLSREEQKARNRDELLDAAALLFARQGFAATSVDDIAAEAHLTKGAVYSQFANKDELLLAVLDGYWNGTWRQRLSDDSILQDAQPVAAASGAFFDVAIRKEQEWWLLWLEALLLATRNPAVHDRLVEIDRPSRSEAQALLAAAVEASGGRLTAPLESVLTAFFALGRGIGLEELVRPGLIDEQMFGRLLGAVLREFLELPGATAPPSPFAAAERSGRPATTEAPGTHP